MKINFFDLCFFDVSNVEKDSFVLESLSFIEDKGVNVFKYSFLSLENKYSAIKLE